MRRLWIALSVALLLAACHSKQKSPDTPVAADTAEDTTPYHLTTPPDGEKVWQTGDEKLPQPTDSHTIHRDTAETTNLRLFAHIENRLKENEMV